MFTPPLQNQEDKDSSLQRGSYNGLQWELYRDGPDVRVRKARRRQPADLVQCLRLLGLRRSSLRCAFSACCMTSSRDIRAMRRHRSRPLASFTLGRVLVFGQSAVVAVALIKQAMPPAHSSCNSCCTLPDSFVSTSPKIHVGCYPPLTVGV